MDQHTLYAAPFTCSFAVHLVLEQHAVPFTLRWTRRGVDRMIEGAEFAAINPKRKVPALISPSGEVITEMVAVMQYLDDTFGPQRSPTQRRRTLEWLSFLATELHKQILAPSFDKDQPRHAVDDAHHRLLPAVIDHLEHTLRDRPMLLDGPQLSVADAYLFWGLLLLQQRQPKTTLPPALMEFYGRYMAQPHTLVALKRERQTWARQPS